MTVRGWTSVVIHSSRPEAAVAFYEALGFAFADDEHAEDAPRHLEAELDGRHFAIWPTDQEGRAPGWGDPGCTLIGFVVDDLDSTRARLEAAGGTVTNGPDQRPWGYWMVISDPDGRPVEIIEQAP